VVNVVFTANGVLAPALGGVLVALTGPATVLVLDAASFVLTAAALATCSLPRLAAERGERSDAVSSLRDALAYVRGHPLLGRLIATDAVLNVFMAAIIPVEVIFVTDTLGGSDAAFGAVLTTWGLGMVLGGCLAARLSRMPLQGMLLVAGAFEAVSCVGMGTAPALSLVLVWSVVGGVGNGMYGMAFVTAYQERTRDAYQARVNGLYESAATIAPGVGFALGGALAAFASPRAVYMAAGIGGLAVLAWAAARLRDADWSPSLGASPAAVAAAA
jgi:MFS family permease